MNEGIKRRGLLIVLSSPSGAGKTTITKKLIKQDSNIQLSVSATTRKKRPQERHERDYYFITEPAFKENIKQNAFIEHAKVYDNWYGTPKAPVDQALEEGRDVLFDIDWQGTQQLAQHYIHDLVRIFILPPSLDELRNRLTKRKSEAKEIIDARMQKASDEISHWAEYEYVLVNNKLLETAGAVASIIQAERLKRRRMIDLPEFVQDIRYGDDEE